MSPDRDYYLAMMSNDDPAVGFRDSDGEWVTWLDAALALRRASLAAVRGGGESISSAWYTEIGDRFRADRPDLFKQLPAPIRRARDTEELGARWLQEHPFPADTTVYDEFEPFLDRLEGIAAPVAPQLETAAEAIDAAWLLENWHKALERRDADPKGAITSARSMLEDVFRVVLKAYEIEAPRKDKLNQLYTRIRKIEELRLAPSPDREAEVNKILSGLVNVVDGLAEMRNQMGDAHGQGRPVSPWARHAALAVHSAGAVAAFLLETVHERRTRGV